MPEGDIAKLIDGEDIDLETRILINVLENLRALRKEQNILGFLYLTALALILWRVW